MMDLQKADAIQILEKQLNEGYIQSEDLYEAISFAIDALKKGSKSWKGYRRFKRKYVVLNHVIGQYSDELMSMNENKENLTWNDAMNIFWKYFKEGDS